MSKEMLGGKDKGEEGNSKQERQRRDFYRKRGYQQNG